MVSDKDRLPGKVARVFLQWESAGTSRPRKANSHQRTLVVPNALEVIRLKEGGDAGAAPSMHTHTDSKMTYGVRGLVDSQDRMASLRAGRLGGLTEIRR